MSFLPSIRAILARRFVFNFRMPVPEMRRRLPVAWLEPFAVGDDAIASFCVLDLRNVTIAPLPTIAGIASVNCAARYAVRDARSTPATDAVYVSERQTDSALAAWMSSLGFPAAHPLVDATLLAHGDGTNIRIENADGTLLFAAAIAPARESRSTLFASAAEFADLMARGVRSYGPSRFEGRSTVVDLHKDDATFEPLDVTSLEGGLVDDWQTGGAVFDGAFQTAGGRYEWIYRGTVPTGGQR